MGKETQTQIMRSLRDYGGHTRERYIFSEHPHPWLNGKLKQGGCS